MSTLDKNETTLQQDQVEIDKPVIVEKSKIEFGTKKAWKSTPPSKRKLIVRTIQGSIGGIVTLCAGTDFISGQQMKYVAFIGGLIGIVLEAYLKASGVVKDEENKT